MKVMIYNLDYSDDRENNPMHITKYDTVKDDHTNGFTLELSNGQILELRESEKGTLEIMTMLGTDCHVLPRSGNMVEIIPTKRN